MGLPNMTSAQLDSLENTLAADDPGDDTANRYRYQWIWAAIVCCALLDDTQDIVEVFCEHHEDVLVKHRDGTFSGHQVKTRSDDQAAWKANDESLIRACVRFAKLEAAYPGRFRHFYFLTNHLLYSAGNGRDISHILKEIKGALTIADLSKSVTTWLRQVARKAKVSEQLAFDAMSKTKAKADLPKLRDALMRLIDAVAQCWPPAAECSHESVIKAAQALIEECSRASALDHEQLLPAYMVAILDNDSEVAARIDGKRMTLSRVERALESGRNSTATLAGDPAFRVKPCEGSTELLHKKLDAGGFSVVSRNSAEDLRDKADYLGIRWTNRYGHEKGLARYEHIRTMVFSDAGRAFDATQTKSDGFGPSMREELRHRFRERRSAGDQLYDATDDHLEGVAFSLTAQCKIVWSHNRPWESQ